MSLIVFDLFLVFCFESFLVFFFFIFSSFSFSFSFFTPLVTLFILLFSFSLLFIFLFLFFFLLSSLSLSLSFSFFFLSLVLFFPVNCSSFFSSCGLFIIKFVGISSFSFFGVEFGSISILLLSESFSILINSLLFFCSLLISSLLNILNKFSFTSLY